METSFSDLKRVFSLCILLCAYCRLPPFFTYIFLPQFQGYYSPSERKKVNFIKTNNNIVYVGILLEGQGLHLSLLASEWHLGSNENIYILCSLPYTQ